MHTYTVAAVYTVTLAVSKPDGGDTERKPEHITAWEEYTVYLPLILRNRPTMLRRKRAR